MWILENKKEYNQRSKRKNSSVISLTNEGWIFLSPKKAKSTRRT